MYVVSGDMVKPRVARRLRRIRATFTVDGRRHSASVQLLRPGGGGANGNGSPDPTCHPPRRSDVILEHEEVAVTRELRQPLAAP